MAGWLEQITETGTGLIDQAGDVAGEVMRNEATGKKEQGKNPDRPNDQPEKQHDTRPQRPYSAQQEPIPDPREAMKEAFNDYKWWAAGGLAAVAVVLILGANK